MRVRRSLTIGFLLLAAPHPAAADEAVLTDGRRLTGSLTLAKSGLLFTAAGRPVPLADIDRVRLTGPSPPPFRVGAVRRLQLRGGQRLTGPFLGLEKEALRLHSAGVGEIKAPRSGTLALTPLPGWLPVLEDDLRGELKAWTVRSGVSPSRTGASLVKPGQALEYAPPRPLSAGRVGVNFEATGAPAGARWELEARFEHKAAVRVLRVAVAGPGAHYEVDAGGLEGTAPRVPRTPGWHRLVLRFTPTSLRVTCDDDALWFNLERGPAGALRQVSLKCVAEKGAERPRGGVTWAEFCVERAVPERPFPAGDSTQDELWLASTDQVFGRVVGASPRAVELEGRFGTRSFAWADLRGWWPRRQEVPVKAPDGPQTRIGLRSGLAPEDDLLDGVVTALDERHLTLRHALLGELRLDRRYVSHLRPR